MIKKISQMTHTQLDRLMVIWLNSNSDAHEFIGQDYWMSHEVEVRAALPNAEIYVYETEDGILGFIGLIDNYIAGLFVDKAYRGLGIGRQLLAEAKKEKDDLQLQVFVKNTQAVTFYQSQDFAILTTQLDEKTNETELVMTWVKK